MKSRMFTAILTGVILFLGVCLIEGCRTTHAAPQKPDEVDSVVHALVTNGFGNVNVSQDRTKGTITLTGSVQSQERKSYAEQIAHVNASDYVIANEINVTPPSPTVAELTEDKFKAALEAHKDLDLQDIKYETKGDTLFLSGSVHTVHQRAEAVKLAKAVPNVERVVDEIKVKR